MEIGVSEDFAIERKASWTFSAFRCRKIFIV